MKKTFLIGICKQCQQLTDECTCPARFERQKLIDANRQAWIEKKEALREKRAER